MTFFSNNATKFIFELLHWSNIAIRNYGGGSDVSFIDFEPKQFSYIFDPELSHAEVISKIMGDPAKWWTHSRLAEIKIGAKA